ncbi:MAG: geranylgeranylglycerol-phosphate geranylgeranyltransferase [Candidatus Hermodarchaeia archaeon]|jgi:geranylgeranylglycerol-phosphate geranylgeranyltransferase
MKVKPFITIMRPANPLFGSLTAIIGVLTTNYFIIVNFGLIRWTIPELLIVLLCTALTYIFMAAAGNVVNDIYDLEVDKVNRPNRPLPSGQITIRQAKAWTVILILLSLLFSVFTVPYSFIGIWTVALAALFAVVGLVYAAKGKVMGIWGNFTVAISFAFGLFYGALVTYLFIPPVIFVYFITAASVLQGREIIKGIEDIEGDALRDVQTIARKYGIRKAAILAAICNIIGIVSFLTPWVANLLGLIWTGPLYIILVIPATLFVAISAILILRNTEERAARASFFDKIGAYLGLLTFLLGSIFIII